LLRWQNPCTAILKEKESAHEKQNSSTGMNTLETQALDLGLIVPLALAALCVGILPDRDKRHPRSADVHYHPNLDCCTVDSGRED
jgi:hypothetical protein